MHIKKYAYYKKSYTDFYEIMLESFKHFNYCPREMLQYFELYVIYFHKNHKTVFETSPVYRNVCTTMHDLISKMIATELIHS